MGKRIVIATGILFSLIGGSCWFASTASGSGGNCVVLESGDCVGNQACGCQGLNTYVIPQQRQVCPKAKSGSTSCTDDVPPGKQPCFQSGPCQATTTLCPDHKTFITHQGPIGPLQLAYDKLPVGPSCP